MKKMRYTIYLMLLGMFLLPTACTTDDIDTFVPENYIYFNVDTEDDETYPSLSYTFTYMDESVKDTTFEIPVKLAGRFLDKDAAFVWQVLNDTVTTATANVHYKILENEKQYIAAGESEGVAKIGLLRVDEMKEKSFDLVLQLVSNDNFSVGPVDKIKVTITDQLVKPDWWVYSPHSKYLGTYSPTKLLLWMEFMEVTDGTDPFESDQFIVWITYSSGYTYKSYKDGELKAAIMAFKNWLRDDKGNPYDEDLESPVAESLGSY